MAVKSEFHGNASFRVFTQQLTAMREERGNFNELDEEFFIRVGQCFIRNLIKFFIIKSAACNAGCLLLNPD